MNRPVKSATQASRTLPSLSVIIPVIDESPRLEILLKQLNEQRAIDLEIVVVDGGSSDDSIEIAERFGASVVQTGAGRAKQMNLGRESATHSLLLFLHADTKLEKNNSTLSRAVGAFCERREQFRVPVAGHFELDFETSDRTFGYRYIEGKTKLNRKNTTNGDQGFLVSAEDFDFIGRFDERMNFLEDQRFAEAFRKRGTWFTLPGKLTTSARRFEKEGFGRRYLVMSITMGIFDAGLDLYFDFVPKIYPVQAETGKLDPMPFLGAIKKTMRALGPIKAAKGWYDVGSYIRSNSWQIFYLADTVLSFEPEGPALRFHDRFVHPLIDNPAANVITTAGAFVFFMGLCPFYFTVLADDL